MSLDYVGSSNENLSSTSGLGITAYPFSFSTLFDPDAQNANYSGIYLGAGDSDYDRIMFRGDVASDPVRAETRVDPAALVTADKTDFTIGTPQHAGATFNTASRISYYMGVAGTETTTSLAIGAAKDLFRIGASFDTAAIGFDGWIAETGVWNVTLTAEDMAALGNHFSPLLIQPAGLVGYWPCHNINNAGQPWKGTYALTVNGSIGSDIHPRIIMPQGMF